MITVADSGSTKTSWLFYDDGNGSKYKYDSAGLNPYYQTSESIKSKVKHELLPLLNFSVDEVKSIHLYVAGCELPSKQRQVLIGIQKLFPSSKIQVYHDLLAAGRALFGNSAGIACISGTGSNSCFYDGLRIVHNVESLGLSLGDEGSGGYKGKLLIRDYIRGDMPGHIRNAFEQKYTDRNTEIMDAVYCKGFPSRYLASYTVFMKDHISDPYIQALLYQSYAEMFQNCISRYKNFREAPIGFIGSVAYHFQDVLKEVASVHRVEISRIIKNPLDELSTYHLQELRVE
ncbi:MAG TPA: hypothetical protein VL947_07035 [Cytophagales bacterium]|nr:hypothetical protein [Cytophagales bacterium]